MMFIATKSILRNMSKSCHAVKAKVREKQDEVRKTGTERACVRGIKE